MGLITTAMISFVLVAMNVGFNGKFFVTWLRSWPISYVLAVSSTLIISPKVQAIVNYLVRKTSKAVKDKGRQ
jgi:hypothetical protein